MTPVHFYWLSVALAVVSGYVAIAGLSWIAVALYATAWVILLRGARRDRTDA